MRVAVCFETAGFLSTTALTGAAARVKGTCEGLHEAGVEVHLFLGDRNPRSAPDAGAWSFMTTYVPDGWFRSSGASVEAVLGGHFDAVISSDPVLVIRLCDARATRDRTTVLYEMHDDERALADVLGAGAISEADLDLQHSASSSADAVIAFTPTDAEAAARLGARHVLVSACGVSDIEDDVAPQPDSGPFELAFVGNLFYEPNREAVRNLLDLVPALPYDVRLNVFGRAPVGFASGGHGTAARFRGPVEDLHAALRRTHVGLAPLRSPTGMKLKVLDCMASGVPVVATRAAMSGLPDADRIAFVADDVEHFPVALDAALGAPAVARAARAAAGLRAVRADHTWSRIGRDLAAELRRVPRRPGDAAVRSALPTPIASYWQREFRARAGSSNALSAPTTPDVRAELVRQGVEGTLTQRFEDTPLTGYDGRSVVYRNLDHVLKVYLRGGQTRRRRESHALRSARPFVPVPEVTAESRDGDESAWLLMTRLHGRTGHAVFDAVGAAERFGAVTARLHGIDLARTNGLQPVTPRDHPALTLVAEEVGLAAVLPVHTECTASFVHGDLSSRNAIDDGDIQLIDFEKAGTGCRYRDLASVLLHDRLLGPMQWERFRESYASVHPVDDVHLRQHVVELGLWTLSWARSVDASLSGRVLTVLAEVTR